MSTTPREVSKKERADLIEAAFQAREQAYSPYSKFRVGAALITEDGRIIKGANVENASYGGTICAERTAIVKAVSDGIRSFIAIAVVSDVTSPISPCGICRQFIREFCPLNLPVLMVPADYSAQYPEGQGEKGAIKEVTLGDLLPYSFGPSDLEKPRIPI